MQNNCIKLLEQHRVPLAPESPSRSRHVYAFPHLRAAVTNSTQAGTAARPVNRIETVSAGFAQPFNPPYAAVVQQTAETGMRTGALRRRLQIRRRTGGRRAVGGPERRPAGRAQSHLSQHVHRDDRLGAAALRRGRRTILQSTLYSWGLLIVAVTYGWFL